MAVDLGEAGNHQRVKENKIYPWPCQSDPKRNIKIFTDDVLTRSPNGTFTKHTGVCCCGIIIPEYDIVEVKDDKRHLILI